MIINDGRILKNGNNISKAQVVDSYVQINSPYYNQMNFTLNGVSVNNPLNIYYVPPTGVQKYINIYDGYYGQNLAPTGEGSYKDFYFSGNLNALTTIEFNNQYYYYGYTYKGDLIKLMNQFPNLTSFIMNYPSNNYYNYSIFNKDISNAVFPVNIDVFRIADSTLSGNINSITNLNKVSDLELVQALFTGNLGSGFTNLTKLNLYYLPYLSGSLNVMFTNNHNLNYIILNECPEISGDVSTLDISNLNYMYLGMTNMPNITGSTSGWTFNTGLTTLEIYNNQYMQGDISKWNLSNTKLSDFLLYGNQSYFQLTPQFYGNLSGWTLPNTINSFQIYFCTGITSIPINYTGNTNLTSLTMSAVNNLSQSINDFKFNDNLANITFENYYGKGNLHGNLGAFVFPLSAITLNITNTYVTGDITQMTFNPILQILELSNNLLTGDINGMIIPTILNDINLAANTGVTLTLSNTPYYSGKTSGVFHTKNITQMSIYNIGEITGDLSNFIIDTQYFGGLYMYGNYNFNCDLSKLNIKNVSYFNITNCPYLYGDLSNWLTGATAVNIYQINISQCSLLTGSTTNWNVNNVYSLNIDNTNLDGKLKMTNPFQLWANSSKISSNIATDFNFANRAYWIDLSYCPNLTGNLSGVTLCNSQYIFNIYGCTGVTGSNSFIEYLWLNRKNFTNNSLQIGMNNIGDSVTGGTKELGDTGTFPIGTGGTGQWNLSESQVNYLVDGLDYTGSGTSIPWTPGQKVYWMENAKISSTNLNLRYIQYNINY